MCVLCSVYHGSLQCRQIARGAARREDWRGTDKNCAKVLKESLGFDFSYTKQAAKMVLLCCQCISLTCIFGNLTSPVGCIEGLPPVYVSVSGDEEAQSLVLPQF